MEMWGSRRDVSRKLLLLMRGERRLLLDEGARRVVRIDGSRCSDYIGSILWLCG